MIRAFLALLLLFPLAASASDRAWLAPTGAEITKPLRPGQPVSFVVYYTNVGNEPATGFVAHQRVGSVPRPVPGASWYTTFTRDRINNVCDAVSSNKDGLVVFHRSGEHKYGVRTDEQTVTPELLAGDHVLYVEGCFAYVSSGVKYKTQYCFMLAGDDHRMQPCLLGWELK